MAVGITGISLHIVFLRAKRRLLLSQLDFLKATWLDFFQINETPFQFSSRSRNTKQPRNQFHFVDTSPIRKTYTSSPGVSKYSSSYSNHAISRGRTMSPTSSWTSDFHAPIKSSLCHKPQSNTYNYVSDVEKSAIPLPRSYNRNQPSYAIKAYLHNPPLTQRKLSEVVYTDSFRQRDSSFHRFNLGRVHKSQPLRNYSYEDLSSNKNVTKLEAGALIKDRYKLMQEIGRGSFGRVFKAMDNVTGKLCAVKAIKDISNFKRLAEEEIAMLEFLAKQDKCDENNFLHLTDHFALFDHTIMVFDLLSVNLYQLIHRNNFRGFAPSLVRKFVKCILSCLRLLHR